ncbi:unnamed protein product [Clonostachys chloroleuca]|uniref:Protein kinase domain-containing protein n=1 Tax=Clonostachys chloroleuca TaxID=1926264 RepID=A0AA35M210_9HYPO|nr:unnamed protein product [Clonostachys chloroleuca]
MDRESEGREANKSADIRTLSRSNTLQSVTVPETAYLQAIGHGEGVLDEDSVDIEPLNFRLDLKTADFSILKVFGERGQMRVVRHRVAGSMMIQRIYDMVDRKQLIRDFRVMSQCVSNRLVTFLGATQGLTDSLGVYMEYMELGSFQRIVHLTGPIPVDILGQVAMAVMEALLYLHEKGFIHRDVRTSRILVNLNGEIKLGGFGLSTLLEDETGSTFLPSYKEKCLYASPERILNKSHGPSNDLVVRIAHGLAPEISEDHDCPESLRSLIRKCLVSDYSQRSTLDELYNDDAFITSAKTTDVNRGEWTSKIFHKMESGQTDSISNVSESSETTSILGYREDPGFPTMSFEVTALLNHLSALATPARSSSTENVLYPLCAACDAVVSNAVGKLGGSGQHMQEANENELFWDCTSLNASESFPSGIPTFYDSDLSQRNLRLFKAALSKGKSWQSLNTRKELVRVYWRKVIENYSARQLITGDELVFGMWKSFLRRELLWWVKDPNNTIPGEIYRSVSWSWISLHGAISFELAHDSEDYIVDPCIEVLDVNIWSIDSEDSSDSDSPSHDEATRSAEPLIGELTLRGRLIPLLPYLAGRDDNGNQTSSPIVLSNWREDIEGIDAGEVKCLIVAASAFYVYGLALYPYPEEEQEQGAVSEPLRITYGRVGFVQWILSDIKNSDNLWREFGWDRSTRWWAEELDQKCIIIR